MQILVKIALLIIAATMVSGAGKKRYDCGPGYRETSRGSSWVWCQGRPRTTRTRINTNPSDRIVVAKLPDTPEFTDSRGRHFDLGFFYSWKIEAANGKTIPGSEKGRFAGYTHGKKGFTTLCQGDLDRIMEVAGWDKLPELPGRLRIAEVRPLKPGYRHHLKRPTRSSSQAEKIAYYTGARKGCTPEPTFVASEPAPAPGVIQKLKNWWQSG